MEKILLTYTGQGRSLVHFETIENILKTVA